jgi:hypothetical protein
MQKEFGKERKFSKILLFPNMAASHTNADSMRTSVLSASLHNAKRTAFSMVERRFGFGVVDIFGMVYHSCGTSEGQ